MMRPLGMIVVALALAGPAFAADKPAKTETHNTRTGTHPDLTRIVLDVSELSKFYTNVTDEGRRILVGIPSVDWEANRHRLKPHGMVERYDFVRRGMKRGMLVIYTNRPARIEYKFTLPPDPADNKGNRLVIDLAPKDLPGKAKMPPRIEPKKAAPAPAPAQAKPKAEAKKPAPQPVATEAPAKAAPKQSEAPDPGASPAATPIFPVPIKAR